MKIHKIGIKNEKRGKFTHRDGMLQNLYFWREGGEDLNENQPACPLWGKTEWRICPRRCSWNSENQRRYGKWGVLPDCPQSTPCARSKGKYKRTQSNQYQLSRNTSISSLEYQCSVRTKTICYCRNTGPTRVSRLWFTFQGLGVGDVLWCNSYWFS